MFIWTRVKLSNQVGARLKDEILLLEKQLGCQLTKSFGLDPYIIGYLAVTASILVEMSHGRRTTIIDKITTTPKCIQLALAEIAPSHRTIHKIINDQDNVLFREGTRTASEVMESYCQTLEEVVPAGFLSKDYRLQPEIYPNDRYFIDYVMANYSVG